MPRSSVSTATGFPRLAAPGVICAMQESTGNCESGVVVLFVVVWFYFNAFE